MHENFKLSFIWIVLLVSGIFQVVRGNPQFTISFRSESIVVGPQISLGEIGKIILNDEKLCHQLKELVIAEAAPPGETREVSLSYIKKCIKELGFNLKQIKFAGPKVLRITTMPNKIIDLLIEDKIAKLEFPAVGGKPDFLLMHNGSITI